jgi:hypothetical protein
MINFLELKSLQVKQFGKNLNFEQNYTLFCFGFSFKLLWSMKKLFELTKHLFLPLPKEKNSNNAYK